MFVWWDALRLLRESAQLDLGDAQLDVCDELHRVDARPGHVRSRRAQTKACAYADELELRRHPIRRQLLLFRTEHGRSQKEVQISCRKDLDA